MPVTMVSHGPYNVPTPIDPPPGDYEAVLFADQASWRITSVAQAWEEMTGLTVWNQHITSPPGLPAVWYAWRGNGLVGGGLSLYKSSNNGTSWTQLDADPFTAGGFSAGAWTAWPDHLTAASEGILVTSRYSDVGQPGTLSFINLYYSLDDGATWSQVFEDDFAVGDVEGHGRERLVCNTAYTWFAYTDTAVRRVTHGGGIASMTSIAMPVGLSVVNVDMLACDSTLDGVIVYAVVEVTGENGRRILRTSALAPTQFVDVTPIWDLDDADLGPSWIAVAGDAVMANAYGYIAGDGDDAGSIWRSTNAGLTWTRMRNWNHDLDCRDSTVGYKAVGNSPNRPNTWFVWANNHDLALGSRVMRSTDNGVTWSFVDLPSADPDGDDDQLYYEVRVLG